MTSPWLVTGSSGFLGSNTGIWLADKVSTVGISRNVTGPSFFGIQKAIDLREHAATAEYIRQIRPSVIFHAGAISGHVTCAQDPEQAFAVNVTATQAISDVAVEVGARLIYISSDAVFPGDTGNYREVDEAAPFSYYGETKLAGEEVVRSTVFNSLIVRTNFFGWSIPGNKSVLEFFVNSLRTGSHVHGYPDSVVTSIYVRSLIETIWKLNELGTTGIVHVASSDALSKHDFGVAVATEFGLDPDLIAPQPSVAPDSTTSRSRNISLDTTLLTSILGKRPQSQAGGIQQAHLDENSIRTEMQSVGGNS